MDIIKKGLKRAKGSKTSVLDTVMSDLTEDTGDFPALNDVSNIPPPSSIGFSQPPPSPTEIKNKKGGRPTGATPGSPGRGNINNSEELPISPTRDEVDENEE
jgi:hypothetical protein